MGRQGIRKALLVVMAMVLAVGVFSTKAQAKAPAKLVKSAGWYVVEADMGVSKKGAYLVCNYAHRMSAKAIKNGKLNNALLFHGTMLSNRKFRLSSKIKYGKLTISGRSVRKLHPTKKVSATALCKAAKTKAVYWLCVKVKGGKIVEARWMPLSSVIMLD